MTKISLTPIIDVVFILLIFFMLATNFQNFIKTDINLTKSSAASTVTDKKVFIIAFDDNSNFKLGNQDMTMEQIKEKILYETKSDQNYAVVVKPEDNTKFQTTLYVLEDRNAQNTNVRCINKMKKKLITDKLKKNCYCYDNVNEIEIKMSKTKKMRQSFAVSKHNISLLIFL